MVTPRPFLGGRTQSFARTICGSDTKLPETQVTKSVPVRVTIKTQKSFLVPGIAVATCVLTSALVFSFWPTETPLVLPAVEEPVRPVEAPRLAIANELVAEVRAVEKLEPTELPGANSTSAVVVKAVGPKKDPLFARLARLKTQLDARDKERGERDRILHRLLDAAEVDLKVAKTSEQRKAVAAQFDDLHAQLRP